MQGKRILIIGNDPHRTPELKRSFDREGAESCIAADSQEGLRRFFKWQPSLIVLDLPATRPDGWDILRQICQIAATPVIVLSDKDDEEDIIRALDMGAFDYLSLPVSPQVLLARARAALRWTDSLSGQIESWNYHDPHVSIDLGLRRVLVAGEQVHLTKKEYQLLAYLLSNAGRVLSFRRILENVWGAGYEKSIASVHVYVSRLRQKLEPDPSHPRYLRTEYGVGYRFEPGGNGGGEQEGP